MMQQSCSHPRLLPSVLTTQQNNKSQKQLGVQVGVRLNFFWTGLQGKRTKPQLPCLTETTEGAMSRLPKSKLRQIYKIRVLLSFAGFQVHI
jgi:hypothetical protein